MKKAISIFAIVMCAVSIMTFNAMSATEVDPAVAAANIQGVIDATKAQNDTTAPETVIIEDAAIPVAEMPEADPAPETASVPETVTTPEPTPAPVALATPTPVQVVPANQDMAQADGSAEFEQEAALEDAKTEEVVEADAENEVEGETDESLVLNNNRTLAFMDNGDITIVEEAGEDPEFMAICMMTIGKWFPTGDISMYNPTENNLGPAIAVYEDEAGNMVTCLNTYRVAANEESEGASTVLLRLVGQLENEGLANMVFRSDVVYNVVNGSMYDAVTVEDTGDAIQVSIPDHELSGADFLTLIEGLQAQL